jgi:hypothetical protein
MIEEELARRLVSLTGQAMASGEPKWHPMDGMLWAWGSAANPMCRRQDIDVGVAGALPDLGDPGTLGCLENTLIPEAWGPEVTISHVDGPKVHKTTIVSKWCELLFEAEGRKAERLVLALEYAP